MNQLTAMQFTPAVSHTDAIQNMYEEQQRNSYGHEFLYEINSKTQHLTLNLLLSLSKLTY